MALGVVGQLREALLAQVALKDGALEAFRKRPIRQIHRIGL